MKRRYKVGDRVRVMTEEGTHKFKPGDRIRVITVMEHGYRRAVAGLEGFVIGYHPDGRTVGCVFPHWGRGHGLQNYFPTYTVGSDGQWVDESALRPAESLTPFQESVRAYIDQELNNV